MPGVAYETFTVDVTIVVGPNNAKRPCPGRFEAAGQGLEPQLPEPESGVLPLDDPAGRDRLYPGRTRAVRSRAGTRGRAASRRRCRYARSPRHGARAPTRGASP